MLDHRRRSRWVCDAVARLPEARASYRHPRLPNPDSNGDSVGSGSMSVRAPRSRREPGPPRGLLRARRDAPRRRGGRGRDQRLHARRDRPALDHARGDAERLVGTRLRSSRRRARAQRGRGSRRLPPVLVRHQPVQRAALDRVRPPPVLVPRPERLPPPARRGAGARTDRPGPARQSNTAPASTGLGLQDSSNRCMPWCYDGVDGLPATAATTGSSQGGTGSMQTRTPDGRASPCRPAIWPGTHRHP